MNPIVLPVAELRAALCGLGKVIPTRTMLPLLANIKIERTSEGWIALTATDLDRWLTVRFEHPAEGPPAAVLVPFNQLQQLTKTCDQGEQLHILPTPQGPILRFALADQLGETKVASFSVAEFPQTPRVKMDSVPLAADLRQSLVEAMECSSTDSTRYVLNGTFIDASNPRANHVVATDGKHLYSANSFALPLKNSVLIPNHKFLAWKEFASDGEWQLRADTQYVQLSSRRWRFVSKQIEGKYPDWRVTVPSPDSAKTIITFDPAKVEVLIRLIERMPCHDDRYRTIGLEWKGGQFFLLGKDKPGEPWTHVPVPDIKGEGEEVAVFLDRRLLAKALGYGLNVLGLIDERRPLRFHSKGRQMIVMPLRPDSAPCQSPAKPPSAPAPIPRTVSPAAHPTEPKRMIARPPSEAVSSPASKSPLEECIDLSLAIRYRLNDGFTLLRELSGKLKNANRESKTNAREMHAVRSTLRNLQALKL